MLSPAVLSASDPLPHRPRRVLVAGISGAGKTTLSRRLAEVWQLPYTELDSLHHGPGWVPRPEFVDEVHALAEEEAWVADWQYGAARDLLAARADTLVWLDLPFPVSLARVVRRTLRRRRRREVLWNGNVEPPLRTFFTDRGHVVRWAISTRRKYRDLVPRALERWPDLVVVRLRRPRDVERWLRGLS